MKQKKALCLMLSLLILVLGIAVPMAMADDETPAGVAGCSSVKVDPSQSLEFQQNICNTAEATAATSCGASGNGTCSSPKLNDVLPDGDHCVCVGESAETAPTGDTATS